jgi:hypothetical protein
MSEQETTQDVRRSAFVRKLIHNHHVNAPVPSIFSASFTLSYCGIGSKRANYAAPGGRRSALRQSVVRFNSAFNAFCNN